MYTEAQVEGYVELIDIKPKVGTKILFPVSVKHINLNKYHGDARSFGYNFDEGNCTIIKYEQVVGVLAEDTISLYKRFREIRSHGIKKPHYRILEVDKLKNHIECSKESELLIHYDENFLYQDQIGYWVKIGEISSFRVTKETAEIYRDAYEEYKRQVILHNSISKKISENMKILKGSLINQD